MTDHQRILSWLEDGQYHCSTELDYMRDARKRISELIKAGNFIEGIPCDGRCGKIHKSKNLKMRRLVREYSLPTDYKKIGIIKPLFPFESRIYDF